MSNELHNAAIEYARRGWPIFPLHGIVDGKCSCGDANCKSPGKHPRTMKGLKDATVDELAINRWWVRWPDANIGCVCGEKTFTVVDLDPAHGGDDSYNGLRDENGAHPETLTQISGSGGTHLCFKYHPDVGNTQGKIDLGIDTRGQGKGYIAVAPSRHISGGVYRWANEGAPLADIPEWLTPGKREAVAAPSPQPINNEESIPWCSSDSDSAHVERRAREYLRHCDPAIEGQGGHSKLLWAARSLVWGYELDESTAYNLLASEYNPRCVPPWNLSQHKDNLEFRRKIRQARTPCDKPKGWLLIEDRIRDEAELEQGRLMAAALIADASVQETPAEVTVPAIPAEPTAAPASTWLNPPGMLGELCHWINLQAYKPQPILTLGNALAFCGALFGRKIRDISGMRTNLYCVGIGESGCGKDNSRKRIKNLCAAANVDEIYLGGEDVTSDAAVESVLQRQPSCLFMWDEIGHMIANIKDRNSSGTRKTVLSMMTRLFTSSDSVWYGKEYAGDNQRRTRIEQPCCSIYGTTVPDIFWQGFSVGEITDGFLGRILAFISDEPDPEPNPDVKILTPPARLAEWVFAWSKFNPPAPADIGEVSALTTTHQVVIEYDNESTRMRDEFERHCKVEASILREKMSPVYRLWMRATEIARKLAMIATAADDPTPGASTIVRSIHMEFACDIAYRHICRLVNEVKGNVSVNDVDRAKQHMIRIIASSGANGLLKSEITNRTPGLTSRARNEMLDELIEGRRVWIKDAPTTKAGGRPGKRYYANTMEGN